MRATPFVSFIAEMAFSTTVNIKCAVEDRRPTKTTLRIGWL